jgi:hypothetical protein
MILSNSALIALAIHLSHGSSVNDLLVYDSLSKQQKAIVLQLINEGDVPPNVEDIIDKECEDGKSGPQNPTPRPPPPKPRPGDPKPGDPKPSSSKESYDI